jgi:hypothetical protein
MRTLLVFLTLTVGSGFAAGEGEKLNKCGCYADDAGTCHCTKKKNCTCPGECEPVGCEAKRQKQMEKEQKAELKKQKDREKKAAAKKKPE